MKNELKNSKKSGNKWAYNNLLPPLIMNYMIFKASKKKSEEDFNLKLEIHSKIQKLPRNSAKIRIRNRCWKTGRPRGYYRDFGVSRHVLREMAHQCLLPGVTKSSW